MAGRQDTWHPRPSRGGFGGRGNSSGRFGNTYSRDFSRQEARDQDHFKGRGGDGGFRGGSGTNNSGSGSEGVQNGQGNEFSGQIGGQNSVRFMGQQDSLQLGQNTSGAGSGFMAGNASFQQPGGQGNSMQMQGGGFAVMPNQSFPQMVPVDLGLGQFGFVPQEQIAQQYQYLLANVPKQTVLQTQGAGKEDGGKDSNKKSDAGGSKELFCDKCKGQGHLKSECKIKVFCVVCQRP